MENRSCIEILVKDIKIYTIDQYTVSQKTVPLLFLL